MYIKQAIATTAVLLGIGIAGAAGQAQERSAEVNWAENLPPGAGKELTVKNCGSCHALERTARVRLSPDKWESTVFDMMGRGAPIFLDEGQLIIKYLAGAFGPTAPPLTDVNQASKEDLIKLPGITPAHADKLLAARKTTPLATRDQAREVLGLDEKAFESIRYFLYVTPPAPR